MAASAWLVAGWAGAGVTTEAGVATAFTETGSFVAHIGLGLAGLGWFALAGWIGVGKGEGDWRQWIRRGMWQCQDWIYRGSSLLGISRGVKI